MCKHCNYSVENFISGKAVKIPDEFPQKVISMKIFSIQKAARIICGNYKKKIFLVVLKVCSFEISIQIEIPGQEYILWKFTNNSNILVKISTQEKLLKF